MNNKVIKAIQEVHEEYKAQGNFGHAGRPGKVGGSAPGGGAGGWSGEGIEAFSRKGNTYTMEDAPYTVNIKFTPKTALGKTVGEKAVITVEDRTLRPGIAHEQIHLDTGFSGKKLNRERVANEAHAYLEKIKRGDA